MTVTRAGADADPMARLPYRSRIGSYLGYRLSPEKPRVLKPDNISRVVEATKECAFAWRARPIDHPRPTLFSACRGTRGTTAARARSSNAVEIYFA